MAERIRACVICGSKTSTLYTLPRNEDLKKKWLEFIFGIPPAKYSPAIAVCSDHFNHSDFSNVGAYSSGFCSRLVLKPGSVPSRRSTTSTQAASAPEQHVRIQHVACQTDPPKSTSVGTQLSMKTLKPHFRSTGTQASVLCSDVCVSTESRVIKRFPFDPYKRPCKRPRLEMELEEEENNPEGSSTGEIEGPHDPTDPVESVTVLTESADSTTKSPAPVQRTPTYIVYENCLMELFQVCPVCTRESDVRVRRLGTFLTVQQHCRHCQYSRRWNSQPILGSTPAGNLQLSAAVYVNGASFFSIEKIFKTMNLKMFHHDTFRRHARMYIEPAIVHKWRTAQGGMLAELCQQQNVILGGDMRTDSPGQNARFGSYTMMDLRRNTVIDVQLVESSEIAGNDHMEQEGLERSLTVLKDHDVKPDCVVTDSHPKTQEFLSEATFTHYFDVGHIEKGLSKKLRKISQRKDCRKLKKWLRSIKNHLYWTAVSSTSGPERVAKWKSILNHIQDIHVHDDPLFPRCPHPHRTSRDTNKWLRAGTPAFCKLKKVLTNERVLRDVWRLSPHPHTPSLEAFHTLTTRFAPKSVALPFLGMLCRLYMAALHFNENAGRPQATTAAGEPLFRVAFPKSKKGECTAKPVKVEPTYRYVGELVDVVFDKVFQDPTPYVEEVLKISRNPDLSARLDKPDELEVISSYVSRINRGRT
ncbi:hypothetical protein ACEWY4_018132 [Coilia grayii]|uniref:THAP-type domain-containing protein n=1 Tax=Coilia grayii TaxID=363190 RepID=A0ABD1JIU5_9TELE